MGIVYIRAFFLVFILGIFATNTLTTPFWRITHDATVVHYVAMLVDQFDRVPYLEIFDTAMPGAILFHIFIGKIFGYTEQALQFMNFILILILFVLNLSILKDFRWTGRLAGAVFFLVVYQSFGQEMSLERDFIGSFFLILALYFSQRLQSSFFQLTMIGLCCGMASVIKPQFVIMLPVFIFFSRGSFFKNIFKSAVFASLPHIISLTWLFFSGGWEYFWWMQKNYLPYYLQIGHDLYYFDTFLERIIHNLKAFFYLVPYWRLSFFILVFGGFLGWKKNKRFVLLIVLLCLCSFFTLIISGQYFPYHFLTFFCFCYYLVSYFFDDNRYRNFSVFSFLLMFLMIFGHFPKETHTFLMGEQKHIVKEGRVDRLIHSIKKNYQKGDTIQVFDWVDGATTHALMNLKLPHSGRFITDHLFKHHLHLETQQEIINSFFSSLKESKPNLIIKSLDHNYPKGDFSSSELPENFLDFISLNYQVIHSDPKFIIYRLNEDL